MRPLFPPCFFVLYSRTFLSFTTIPPYHHTTPRRRCVPRAVPYAVGHASLRLIGACNLIVTPGLFVPARLLQADTKCSVNIPRAHNKNQNVVLVGTAANIARVRGHLFVGGGDPGVCVCVGGGMAVVTGMRWVVVVDLVVVLFCRRRRCLCLCVGTPRKRKGGLPVHSHPATYYSVGLLAVLSRLLLPAVLCCL